MQTLVVVVAGTYAKHAGSQIVRVALKMLKLYLQKINNIQMTYDLTHTLYVKINVRLCATLPESCHETRLSLWVGHKCCIHTIAQEFYNLSNVKPQLLIRCWISPVGVALPSAAPDSK